MSYYCRGKITAIQANQNAVKIWIKSNVQWDPQKMGMPQSSNIAKNIFLDSQNQSQFIGMDLGQEITVDTTKFPINLLALAYEKEECDLEIKDPKNPQLVSLNIGRK